jgi:hypothetical protein
MTISRRTAILTGACAVIGGAMLLPTASNGDAATTPVIGRKLRWVSILPNNGWVGGDVNEIRARVEAIKASKADEFDKFMGGLFFGRMIPFAELCDVYFVNAKDGVTKSRTVTTIRTDVITKEGSGFEVANDDQRMSLAQRYAKSVKGAPGARDGEAAAGKVEFVEQGAVAGRPAVRIGLRAALPDNSAFYDVLCVVELGGGNLHVFELTVDAEHFADRLNDVGRMLQAIRYLM